MTPYEVAEPGPIKKDCYRGENLYLLMIKCFLNATECTVGSLSYLPLATLHRADGQGFKNSFLCRGGGYMFPRGVGTGPTDIMRRIEEYTGRDLSNPLDILKGMMGIFNSFESQFGLRHYAGIPILPGSQLIRSKKLTGGLTQSMRFLTGLSWERYHPGVRRHAFASCLWTGWFGEVFWSHALKRKDWNIKIPLQFDPNVQVKVQLKSGLVLPIEKYQASILASNPSTQLSNTIHITAWTIEFERGHMNRDPSMLYQRQHVTLKLKTGESSDWHFFLETHIGFIKSGLCKGVILGYASPVGGRYSYARYYILVCEKTETAFERIGNGWLLVDPEVGTQESEFNPVFVQRVSEGLSELVKTWEEIELM
jgi:hypothetical protein